MSLRQAPYQNGEAARRAPEDASDVEEEALANDYREQVQYDGMDDLDRMPSNITSNQDIHAQLQAAATPLEFQATLETKFASYDNYCNLFHYILNSEGPVDLEVPNVRVTAAAAWCRANAG
jgi:translation initiation factor 3 subunit L